MKQKYNKWTPGMDAVLRKRYPNDLAKEIAHSLNVSISAIYQRAKKLNVKKSEQFFDSQKSGLYFKGHRRSPTTEFKKGMVPWNKGMKGLNIGGKETQFKKGQKPLNHRPIGSERLTKDGYRQRKITDTGYPPKDWVGIHRLIWEAEHGPVPNGCIVRFKDGNKQNITLENLELISQSENLKRNGIEGLPKPLADLHRLRGAITRQINKQKRESHEHK